jgi:hypothetical protein
MRKLLAVLLLTPTLAMAEFYTGNTLLSKMRSTSLVDNSLALGYVLGVFDSNHSITHCPPANVTAGQVQDMIKQFLEQAPSVRNSTADVIIQAVLMEAWPCQSYKPRGKSIGT